MCYPTLSSTVLKRAVRDCLLKEVTFEHRLERGGGEPALYIFGGRTIQTEGTASAKSPRQKHALCPLGIARRAVRLSRSKERMRRWEMELEDASGGQMTMGFVTKVRTFDFA